jgi:hypothetical protein
LNDLLGFEHEAGINFLLITGLIKRGSIRDPNGYSVIPSEWEEFVVEEKLKNTVTITSIERSRF